MMETLLSAFAIIISALAFFVSLYTHFATMKRDRKQATLEAYNRLDEQALEPLERYTPSQIQEIVKDRKSGQYKTVSGYVARIEHFCVGINTGIYDRDVLYELAHGFLDKRMLLRIQPVIETKQSDAKEDFYTNTHKILQWMQEKSEEKQ